MWNFCLENALDHETVSSLAELHHVSQQHGLNTIMDLFEQQSRRDRTRRGPFVLDGYDCEKHIDQTVVIEFFEVLLHGEEEKDSMDQLLMMDIVWGEDDPKSVQQVAEGKTVTD